MVCPIVFDPLGWSGLLQPTCSPKYASMFGTPQSIHQWGKYVFQYADPTNLLQQTAPWNNIRDTEHQFIPQPRKPRNRAVSAETLPLSYCFFIRKHAMRYVYNPIFDIRHFAEQYSYRRNVSIDHSDVLKFFNTALSISVNTNHGAASQKLHITVQPHTDMMILHCVVCNGMYIQHCQSPPVDTKERIDAVDSPSVPQLALLGYFPLWNSLFQRFFHLPSTIYYPTMSVFTPIVSGVHSPLFSVSIPLRVTRIGLAQNPSLDPISKLLGEVNRIIRANRDPLNQFWFCSWNNTVSLFHTNIVSHIVSLIPRDVFVRYPYGVWGVPVCETCVPRYAEALVADIVAYVDAVDWSTVYALSTIFALLYRIFVQIEQHHIGGAQIATAEMYRCLSREFLTYSPASRSTGASSMSARAAKWYTRTIQQLEA